MKPPIYKNFNNEYQSIPNNLDITRIENRYKKNKTPILKEEYDLLFKEYLCPKNFLKNNKRTILKNIYEDSKSIYDSLKILPEIGIPFYLDLVGGSVRDFILDNEEKIKDLDFMLNIDLNLYLIAWQQDKEEFWKNKKNELLHKINEIKITEQKDFSFIVRILDEYKDNFNSNNYYKIQHQLEVAILNFCFKNQIKQDFFKTKDFKNQEEYSTDRLKGVIKLIKKNYEIDLLITKFTKKEFLSSFDFNLCKASFSIISFYYNYFPQNENDFLERTNLDVDFFADIKNKKLTINVDFLSIKDIENSIFNHYPRLQKKYIDYKINIIGHNEEKLKVCSTCLEYQKLKNEVNSSQNIIKNKLKI